MNKMDIKDFIIICLLFFLIFVGGHKVTNPPYKGLSDQIVYALLVYQTAEPIKELLDDEDVGWAGGYVPTLSGKKDIIHCKQSSLNNTHPKYLCSLSKNITVENGKIMDYMKWLINPPIVY